MTTLEKMRAEIEQKMSTKPNEFNQHDESDYDRGLFMALLIIDKYAEQEPTDEWQNGYDRAWEEAEVFYEKEEPTSPCDWCKYHCKEVCCPNCPYGERR